MRRTVVNALRAGSLCVLGAGLAGCGSSNWWMFQGSLAHTGHYPGRSPIVPLHLRWNAALLPGTVSLTPPVFGRGKIFIGSGYGNSRLYALSPNNGGTIWSFAAAANSGFFGAPAAAGDTVYAATLGQNPHVYALRQANGAPLWQTPLPVGSSASVAVGAGRVFVNTDQHKLYALNQASGAILWSANTSPGVSSEESSPAVGFGKVFVGSDDGLFAFNVLSGNQLWKFPLNDTPGFSSPVINASVAGGNPALVYIGTNDRKLYAVRETNGTQAWSFTASATLAFGSVALAEGKVFLFDFQTVTALDANTGAVVWTHAASQIPRHSPAVAYGVLYYSDDARVHGVRTSNGAPVWASPIPGNGNANAPGNALGIEFELLVVPNKGHVHAFTGP